jgi:signal transduction histidine kinase
MVGNPVSPKSSEDTLRAFARLLGLASSRGPLVALLDELLRFAEQLTPQMRCSILLADLSAGVLRGGAAPSLPPAYTSAIEGLPIAEGVGSCGTAAARRETVVVGDIASSPLWSNYTDLAKEHGLGACWSVPLMDSRGLLLGTCAMYYTNPRTPTAAEEDLIEITGNLAAMVIQRHRDAEDLRASEARHRQDVTDVRNSYQRIRELVQRLETVREDERRSVANELHEGIAQDLFALKLRVEHIQARAADRNYVKEACLELAEALGKCMSAARQIANDLQPNALAHLPLPVALREHARYFGEISGLTVRIVEISPVSPIAEDTSLILFRAAQEALTNVARHARASRVDIVLRTEADSITMEVVDDGIGIENTALTKAGCFGLLGIQERMSALGGALDVLMNREGGTTVVVQVPV